MANDFNEPWILDVPSGPSGSPCIKDCNGEFFGIGQSSDEGEIDPEDPRFRRIAACVNACAGIPTEALECVNPALTQCINDVLDGTFSILLNRLTACSKCGISRHPPSAVEPGLCTNCANHKRGVA